MAVALSTGTLDQAMAQMQNAPPIAASAISPAHAIFDRRRAAAEVHEQAEQRRRFAQQPELLAERRRDGEHDHADRARRDPAIDEPGDRRIARARAREHLRQQAVIRGGAAASARSAAPSRRACPAPSACRRSATSGPATGPNILPATSANGAVECGEVAGRRQAHHRRARPPYR